MALPFAARQHFLEHGYAIIPNVLSADVVGRICESATASVVARARYFTELPLIEQLLKSKPKYSDPVYETMMSHIEKRRFLLRYYRHMKRQKRQLRRVAKDFLNGRSTSDLSGEELWKLSELVSAAALRMSGKGCTSTVRNDPQMLSAINEYRVNAWMTNSALETVIRDGPGFCAPVAELAEVVGGVERPVLFSDAPVFRGPYGNPVGYHCTAPCIGTRTNGKSEGGQLPAVTIVIFTHTPSNLCLSPYILANSHRTVKEQYARQVRPETLFPRFLPMEADMRDQLRRFHFDDPVVAVPLLSTAPSATDSSAPLLCPGTVMVVDPHLMMAFGPNLTSDKCLVYRINVVSEDARPFLSAPSWIRGWRTVPREVSFSAPVVFPPLYAKAVASYSTSQA